MEKEFLTPEFKSINPLQKIPYLVHNDLKIGESAAIITYLADHFQIDTQWYPKDLKLRAKINSYLHWHHIGLRHRIDEYLQAKVIWPIVFDMHHLNDQWEKWLIIGVDNALNDLQELIEPTGFVAGTQVASIADVFAYTQITMLELLEIGLERFGKILEWKEKIERVDEVRQQSGKFQEWLQQMMEKIRESKSR